jgi:simple sugar transport system permease protein
VARTDVEALIAAALAGATPLVIAGLGGLFSERAGIIAIGLEGFMLSGAFVAALVATKTGSPALGILAAIVGGLVLGRAYALVTVQAGCDQVVSGVALNMLASGLTLYFTQIAFERQRSFALPDGVELRWWWFAGMAVVLLAATKLVLDGTVFGLRLKAVGEKPIAAETAGIDVTRTRILGVMLSGAIAGLAGAYLPFYSGSFVKNMTAGRGFMALAAIIFGQWRAGGVLMAGVVFGLLEALQDLLQGTPVFGVTLPSQFAQMIPYVMTIVILAGVIGRATPPAALGIPYERESR